MWIKAVERKPDNSRRVLVQTNSKYLRFARWRETEDSWDFAGDIVAYWMEISNLLSLPIESAVEQNSEIDVPVADTLVRPTLGKRGWGWPASATKRHYWNDDLICLCGRWMYTGELHDEENYHKDAKNNCKVCQKKVAKLQETMLDEIVALEQSEHPNHYESKE